MEKILIIDDEKGIRDVLKEIVETIIPDNLIVLTAKNAESGLELAVQEKPDIIFCDINLPGKSGLEVIPEFRNTLKDVLIIAMSGHSYYKEKAIMAGANFFLKKPFDVEEVEKILLE